MPGQALGAGVVQGTYHRSVLCPKLFEEPALTQAQAKCVPGLETGERNSDPRSRFRREGTPIPGLEELEKSHL